MLILRILTKGGDLVIIEGAQQCVYVKICPYLDHEFHTENPAQRFCSDSHRVSFFKKNDKRNGSVSN